MRPFTPSRFRIARKRRGLNMTTLATLVGVTPRSLTEYEAGRTAPLDETIERIAAELRFPVEFFSAPEIEEPQQGAVSFRALASMPAAQREAAKAAGALAFEVARWIEGRFRLPAADLPDLRGVSPEDAAAALRERWGIGAQSVRSVVHVLELHGVRVFSLCEQARELDAYSLWHRGTPYCFLNTLKSSEHSRFDAAHELGHLVLHRHGSPSGREAEHEADAFASAFLMPRGMVLGHVPRGASLPKLVELKARWNVSVAALAYRAHKLAVLSDWHYRTLCIEMNRLGYTTSEPRPLANRETSQVLEKVFAALRGEGIGRARVAAELHLHPEDFDALVFGLTITPVAGGRQGGTTRARDPNRLRLVTE